MTVGTSWLTGSVIHTPSFDRDGRPGDFNDDERREIIAIWSAVAEDYAPFDIDITTGGLVRSRRIVVKTCTKGGAIVPVSNICGGQLMSPQTLWRCQS